MNRRQVPGTAVALVASLSAAAAPQYIPDARPRRPALPFSRRGDGRARCTCAATSASIRRPGRPLQASLQEAKGCHRGRAGHPERQESRPGRPGVGDGRLHRPVPLRQLQQAHPTYFHARTRARLHRRGQPVRGAISRSRARGCGLPRPPEVPRRAAAGSSGGSGTDPVSWSPAPASRARRLPARAIMPTLSLVRCIRTSRCQGGVRAQSAIACSMAPWCSAARSADLATTPWASFATRTACRGGRGPRGRSSWASTSSMARDGSLPVRAVIVSRVAPPAARPAVTCTSQGHRRQGHLLRRRPLHRRLHPHRSSGAARRTSASKLAPRAAAALLLVDGAALLAQHALRIFPVAVFGSSSTKCDPRSAP